MPAASRGNRLKRPALKGCRRNERRPRRIWTVLRSRSMATGVAQRRVGNLFLPRSHRSGIGAARRHGLSPKCASLLVRNRERARDPAARLYRRRFPGGCAIRLAGTGSRLAGRCAADGFLRCPEGTGDGTLQTDFRCRRFRAWRSDGIHTGKGIGAEQYLSP